MNEAEDSRKRIWEKGKQVPGSDPDEIRKDDYGYWMKFSEFQTDDMLSWDYERRVKIGSVTESDLFPVSRLGSGMLFQVKV